MTTATETTDLVLIPQGTALEVFTTPGALAPYLERIREMTANQVPDLSTVKGRKAIASLAHQVARSKSYLEGIGKALADEQKEVPKKIDAGRRECREYLDALKDEIRAPLTEWERAEEAKKAAAQAIVDQVVALYSLPLDATAEQIRCNLTALECEPIPDEAGDRLEEAETKRAHGVQLLTKALAERVQFEAQQEELARLRKAQEERDRQDRERQIAEEAAERARTEEQNRQRAQAEESQRRQEAAEQARLDAEQRARDAEERETRFAEQERQRQQQARELELQQQQEEQRRREQDQQHRASINRAALDALVAGGIPDDMARQVITLIVRRQVPGISINY